MIEAEKKQRATAQLMAVDSGEAVELRRLSSGKKDVCVRRTSGWFVSPAAGPPRSVAAESLVESIGTVYDCATALAAPDARGQSLRRDAARQEAKRLKLAETKHAENIATKALLSREEHEAAELKRRLCLSDEAFAAVAEFSCKPRVVQALGTTVTKTFNGQKVACRTLVLNLMSAPLKEGAENRAAKKKKRKGGAPNTKNGLTGFEQLRALDEMEAEKKKLEAEKLTAAVGRQATAADKLNIAYEDKIPGIVAKLDELNGAADKLPVASLVLLVRWSQENHAVASEYKVKGSYKKEDTAPLLFEYSRVRLSPERTEPLLEELRASALRRHATAAVAAAGAAAANTSDHDSDDDEEEE